MRIGELLVEQANIDPTGIDRALRLQGEAGERLGAILVQLGLVAERDLARALAAQLEIELAGPGDYPDSRVLGDEVEGQFLRRARAAPLAMSADQLTVALADPLDRFVINALQLATALPVEVRVGVPSDIDAALERQYAGGAAAAELAAEEGIDGDDIQQLRDMASEAPTIRIVNQMIGRALEARASDIHVEPFADMLKVRFRIDGVLQDTEAPPRSATAAVISRIKVMASLNIAERRLPQDGRIRLRIDGRDIDMRVSTVPTLHGESVVMRILDKGGVALDLATLGFTPRALDEFAAVLTRPQGVILVTGPTGSGKTTTLYAALQRLNTPTRKILTVEDPVEYRIEGINQIQVKPAIGLSFANALRSILRQDPEVIMIGEMRDVETARIAVQAALTGHRVFSTLHTNDAASSVTRLLDMGVEGYLVTSTVDCVLAQRLVRRLCADCREPYPAEADLAREIREAGAPQTWDGTLQRARGCDGCHHTGYHGRTTVLELLVLNPQVRDAVLEHGDADAVRRAALAGGMRTIYQDGLCKAASGDTTVEEVLRVTRD